MSDVFSLFEQEAANPQAFEIREGETKNLSSLIRRSVELINKSKIPKTTKRPTTKKRSVDEEDIPSLMETMGVESLTVDGNKVSIDKFVSASIPETKKRRGFPIFLERLVKAILSRTKLL